MSTALQTTTPQQNNIINLENPTVIETIKNTVAKGATNDQLKTFLTLAKHYNLNPFNKEIYFSSHIGVHVGRHGQLRIANRHPEFRGLRSCVIREKDEFEFDVVSGNITKHITGKNKGPVIGAWAKVERKGHATIPVVCWLEDFKKSNPAWRDYSQDMITYKAEMRALRNAFNSEFEGLTIIEPDDEMRMEMGRKTAEETFSPAVAQATAEDWLGEKAEEQKEPEPERVATKDLQVFWTKVNKAGLEKEFVKDELISAGLIDKDENGEYSTKTMLAEDFEQALYLIDGLSEDPYKHYAEHEIGVPHQQGLDITNGNAHLA